MHLDLRTDQKAKDGARRCRKCDPETFWENYGCFFYAFGGLAVLLYILYAFLSSERVKKWEESVTFGEVGVFLVGAFLLFLMWGASGGGGTPAKPFFGYTRDIDNDDSGGGE